MYFLSLDILHTSLAILLIAITVGVGGSMIRTIHSSRHDRESRNYTTTQTHTLLIAISTMVTGALLAIALLGPLSPWDGDSEREGSEIIWILDVSKSMDVRDLETTSGSTSRLTRAKQIMDGFMTEHPEHRYGLVIFAGTSRLVSPLTSSTDSLLTFLGSIDSTSISEGGSDFEKALLLATERFVRSDDTTTRGFVLLSDGGDREDAPDMTAIKNLFRNKHVQLTTIGLGSEQGGPIPIGNDPFGSPIYKQYEGETVVSALNTSNLRSLAEAGDGSYLDGDINDDDIIHSLGRLTRQIIRSVESRSSSDIGRLFVIAAFPFFLVSLMTSGRLKYPSTTRHKTNHTDSPG